MRLSLPLDDTIEMRNRYTERCYQHTPAAELEEPYSPRIHLARRQIDGQQSEIVPGFRETRHKLNPHRQLITILVARPPGIAVSGACTYLARDTINFGGQDFGGERP